MVIFFLIPLYKSGHTLHFRIIRIWLRFKGISIKGSHNFLLGVGRLSVIAGRQFFCSPFSYRKNFCPRWPMQKKKEKKKGSPLGPPKILPPSPRKNPPLINNGVSLTYMLPECFVLLLPPALGSDHPKICPPPHKQTPQPLPVKNDNSLNKDLLTLTKTKTHYASRMFCPS